MSLKNTVLGLKSGSRNPYLGIFILNVPIRFSKLESHGSKDLHNQLSHIHPYPPESYIYQPNSHYLSQ